MTQSSKLKEPRYQLQTARLGVKLNYVIPTVNFQELAQGLSKSLYQIDQTGPAQFVAYKESAEIYLDGQKDVFGVRSDHIEYCRKTLEEIITLSREILETDLRNYIYYFEFEIFASYYLSANVYRVMKNLYGDSKDIEKMTKIFSGSYSQISINLAKSEKNINSTDWDNLIIEPKINSSGNIFSTRYLIRNPSLDTAERKALQIKDITVSIIEKVLLKN